MSNVEKKNELLDLIVSARSIAAAQIVFGLVHEIKNGLNTIAVTNSNLIHLIQNDKHIIKKKQYIDKLESVDNEILLLYNLTKRFQEFSKQPLAIKSKLFVNEIIMSVHELVKSTLARKRIILELKLHPLLNAKTDSRGYSIFADRAQVEQAILNLLLNAIDASLTRSKINIMTQFDKKKELIEIRIEDYGMGILPENIPRSFEPFFTTKEDAAGLGLYVTRAIIETNHNGKLYIKSKVGKGTSVSVFMPVGST